MKLKAILMSALFCFAVVAGTVPQVFAADIASSQLAGDADGNGVFEADDADLLCRYLLGTETEMPDWKNADMNGDNALTAVDLSLLKQELINRRESIKTDETKHEAAFVRAKDGDTYVVTLDGEDKTVRIIGVDTPESVAPDSYDKENTEEGKTVSEIVKATLLKGDTVYLEFDVSETDKYGRLLAYVYFDSGVMVEDWLLSRGYAQVMTVQPNSKYAEHFAEVEHIAAERKVGLWNGFFVGEEE